MGQPFRAELYTGTDVEYMISSSLPSFPGAGVTELEARCQGGLIGQPGEGMVLITTTDKGRTYVLPAMFLNRYL